MKLKKTNIYPDIDPRLQRHMDRLMKGIVPKASASTEAGEISVIAKVEDLDKWAQLSEIREGALIGKDKDGKFIVTARIPLSRLVFVRTQPFVTSLKPAHPLKLKLFATIEETFSRADLLPELAKGNQGEGVIIGIIDYGCDFAHKNFRNDDGSTRLLAIWDQEGIATPKSPFGYGRVYEQSEINEALQNNDPYEHLGYNPLQDPSGTHGTHVMDIAGGNGKGSETPGVAPNAELIFVQIDNTDIDWSGPNVTKTTFGDSVHLLEAARFIFDKAGNRPCVINISLGTNGGPHDGTSLVEQGLDIMLNEAPNRSIVIAASNSFDDKIHTSGIVSKDSTVDLIWEVQHNDFTHNEMEVWYSGKDVFEIELISPDGASIGTVPLGTNASFDDDTGRTLLFVAHRKNDPGNGDNVIDIFMDRQLSGGQWTVRLCGKSINKGGGFHAWIERDDANPSQFGQGVDDSFTLGSISCGYNTVVVGSYDAHKNSVPISWFSSAGPTRDGRQKPEISAPGHAVWAARSGTFVDVVSKSGTSMAAPAVSGVVALIMSEARALGKNISVEQIRNILSITARSNPPRNVWDKRYGMGRVNAAAAIKAVHEM